MKEDLEFYERQQINQWWLYVLLGLVNAFFIYGCITQVGMGKLWGNNPMPDVMLVIVTVIMFLGTASIFFTRVDTVINREGVWLRVFPSFRLSFKLTPWDNISGYVVRKKNLIRDKRGIGYKIVSKRVGNKIQMVRQTTYNLSGNYVLELKLINKKELIIGTQRPEELAEFLSKLDAERKQK